jgi:hypothetical protein
LHDLSHARGEEARLAQPLSSTKKFTAETAEVAEMEMDLKIYGSHLCGLSALCG